MTSPTEQAAVLALARSGEGEWHRTAALIDQAGSAQGLLRGDPGELDPLEVPEAGRLASRVKAEDLPALEEMIGRLRAQGVRLVTVLDEDYPPNLRQIFNLPPFLFIRGHLTPADSRAVAIVGTRKPSEEGLEQARRLAGELARRDVTVLSGLARGIDTAAHEAALEAGGRTVAVMGTGIRRVYPPDNEALAERIVGRGALVSQFLPDAPPTKWSFPMRNIVMSGMAIGTVVVEASATSGAKSQARQALNHGKRLFLVRSLVLQEEWAKRYAAKPATTVVDSVDDILDVLTTLAAATEQLTLT